MLLGDKAYARQTLPTVGLKCFRKVTVEVDSRPLSGVLSATGGVMLQPKQISHFTLDPHLLASSCLFATFYFMCLLNRVEQNR